MSRAEVSDCDIALAARTVIAQAECQSGILHEILAGSNLAEEGIDGFRLIGNQEHIVPS